MAQSIVGYNYLKGCGTPKDALQAYIWCSIAAAKGDKDAIRNIAFAKKELTLAQISQAQECADQWIPTTKENASITLKQNPEN